MGDVTKPTPSVTPTRQVACLKTDCAKMYKGRSSMLTHMRQKHQDVAEIESPLGSFPSSTSATTLQFDDSDNSATQGNSRGQINSPKVRSEATYVCDQCEMHLITSQAQQIQN